MPKRDAENVLSDAYEAGRKYAQSELRGERVDERISEMVYNAYAGELPTTKRDAERIAKGATVDIVDALEDGLTIDKILKSVRLTGDIERKYGISEKELSKAFAEGMEDLLGEKQSVNLIANAFLHHSDIRSFRRR